MRLVGIILVLCNYKITNLSFLFVLTMFMGRVKRCINYVDFLSTESNVMVDMNFSNIPFGAESRIQTFKKKIQIYG